MITVVSGVIVKDSRIFFQQRPPAKDYAYLWETPGGKVEYAESFHGTIRRELREELGIEVRPIGEQSIACVDCCTEAGEKVNLIFFPVFDYSGEIKLLDGQAGSGWFTINEARHLSRTPGNIAAEGAFASYIAALEYGVRLERARNGLVLP